MCGSVCLGLNKAHADCDCCEAMPLSACLCVLMHKAHAHCDCSEAMHACVGVSVLLCTRQMVTVIATRLCMYEAMHACFAVLFGLVQGTCSR